MAKVVEVGDGVRSVKRGDRVVVPFQISCGECARCKAGMTGSSRRRPSSRRTASGRSAAGRRTGRRRDRGRPGGRRASRRRTLRIGRFPITVDATAREEGLRFVLGSTDAWGECTSVGIYFGDVALPLFELYTRGIHFTTGRVDARRYAPLAIDAAKGSLDLAAVATSIVPWADAADVWTEPATKLVLRR